MSGGDCRLPREIGYGARHFYYFIISAGGEGEFFKTLPEKFGAARVERTELGELAGAHAAVCVSGPAGEARRLEFAGAYHPRADIRAALARRAAAELRDAERPHRY